MDSAHPGGGTADEEGVNAIAAMMHRPFVLNLLKIATLAWALALPSMLALAAEPTDAEIDQGREVYGELCVSCHGRDMVNPGGVTFDLRKFPKDDFERFRSSVLNGKPPAMPSWRDKVGDDDIRLLWAYVRSGG
jgi:mono/diheme cytochrome c family protein